MVSPNPRIEIEEMNGATPEIMKKIKPLQKRKHKWGNTNRRTTAVGLSPEKRRSSSSPSPEKMRVFFSPLDFVDSVIDLVGFRR